MVHHVLPVADSEKEARFQRVAEAVVALLLEAGPEACTWSTVARRAGVSRAWLYKYFGADHHEAVDFGVRLYGRAFTDLDVRQPAPDTATWRMIQQRTTAAAFDEVLSAPWVLDLWFRYRLVPGRVGDAVREIEAAYLQKFVDELPAALAADRAGALAFARAFSAARMGALHVWRDEALRAEVPRDAWLRPLLDMVDGFLRRATA